MLYKETRVFELEENFFVLLSLNVGGSVSLSFTISTSIICFVSLLFSLLLLLLFLRLLILEVLTEDEGEEIGGTETHGSYVRRR